MLLAGRGVRANSRSWRSRGVELAERPEDLHVRSADLAAFDLRQVGVGDAGAPFDVAQAPAAVLTGAAEDLPDSRFAGFGLVSLGSRPLPTTPSGP